MADHLFDGKRFRLLTLVDNFSRESLAIQVGTRLTGDDVVVALERVKEARGCPESIRVDNGPEFISKSLDWWAYFNNVTLDFSRLGKPTDNAYIESFNGRVRQECLNQHWFLSLADAQEQIDQWRRTTTKTVHIAHWEIKPQWSYRVGGGISSPVLPHHRAYGSVHGGSL